MAATDWLRVTTETFHETHLCVWWDVDAQVMMMLEHGYSGWQWCGEMSLIQQQGTYVSVCLSRNHFCCWPPGTVAYSPPASRPHAVWCGAVNGLMDCDPPSQPQLVRSTDRARSSLFGLDSCVLWLAVQSVIRCAHGDTICPQPAVPRTLRPSCSPSLTPAAPSAPCFQ